ncbi:low affinity iron permease family protein [Methylocystis echinoides]|uniref:low affinity iron permease family protein n=1 Tax=Methylocystis echinoides TaxID=29468 RepID=UPI0034215A12
MLRFFSNLATTFSHWAGHPSAFLSSALIVMVWAALGPVFNYSDTWQLIINTGTTIVTFLMVFLIQSAQNRDAAAIQAKLDELIRASQARNRFIGIERLPEDELQKISELCRKAATNLN